MNRVIVQFGAIPQDTDLLLTNRHAMVGIGMALASLFGSGNTGPYVEGLPCTPGTGLTVSIGQGSIYALAAIDSTAYGSLAADTTDQIIQQGNLFGATSLACPAPATTGQSINYLIEAQFQQVDVNPVALLYYNSASPLQPLLGTATNTQRSGICALQVKAGTPATTGSQTTPSADSGWTGLYVVTVAHGATSIVTGNIAGAAGAPVLAGLLNSHHGGVPGQAPQINLATEVQGVLPIANLPADTFGGVYQDTGAANACVIATTPVTTSYHQGQSFRFSVAHNNTGAMTLNAGGGAVAIVRPSGAATEAGDALANQIIVVSYETGIGFVSNSLLASDFLDTPALRGAPTAPTPTPGTNNTQLATMAALQTGLASIGAGAIPTLTANATIIPGPYNLDSSGGSFTLTLTASLVQGQAYEFVDLGRACDKNPVLINTNGNTLEGAVQNYNYNVSGEAITLYRDATTLKVR